MVDNKNKLFFLKTDLFDIFLAENDIEIIKKYSPFELIEKSINHSISNSYFFHFKTDPKILEEKWVETWFVNKIDKKGRFEMISQLVIAPAKTSFEVFYDNETNLYI